MSCEPGAVKNGYNSSKSSSICSASIAWRASCFSLSEMIRDTLLVNVLLSFYFAYFNPFLFILAL